MYPQVLKTGVPLGVTSPTLGTPNVWPTKEELSGEPTQEEDLPDPIPMDNYSSAIEFEDQIEKTLEEEKGSCMLCFQMWIGSLFM